MKSANSPRHCAIHVPFGRGRPVSDTRMQRDPGAHPVPFDGISLASCPAVRTLGAATASSAGSASSDGAGGGCGVVEGGGGCGAGPPQLHKHGTRREQHRMSREHTPHGRRLLVSRLAAPCSSVKRRISDDRTPRSGRTLRHPKSMRDPTRTSTDGGDPRADDERRDTCWLSRIYQAVDGEAIHDSRPDPNSRFTA